MSLDSGVSLGTLVLSLFSIVAAGAVTWGGLLQRVKTLEREVAALSGFAADMATVKADLAHVKSAVEQITNSWLFREPPGYDAIERPIGAPPPRRRPR